MTHQQHWNDIFSSKQDEEMGWYEADVSQTLKFIDKTELPNVANIFVPGAGTSNLVEALSTLDAHLILNDISDTALAKLAARIAPSHAEFFQQNMGQPLKQSFVIDLWVDRAVLHFLLTEGEICTYFDNLHKCVKQGGYVLLAEFSKQGVKKCAGLEVHQYDLEEMQARLGDEFQLLASEDYIYINPFGQERPYIYGLFQRLG